MSSCSAAAQSSPRPLLHRQLARLVRRCLIVPRRRRCRSAQRRPRFQDFPRCRRSLLGYSSRRGRSGERCCRRTRRGTREQRKYRTHRSSCPGPSLESLRRSPALGYHPENAPGLRRNKAFRLTAPRNAPTFAERVREVRPMARHIVVTNNPIGRRPQRAKQSIGEAKNQRGQESHTAARDEPSLRT